MSGAMDRTFDVPAHVVTREMDGELVLLSLESGNYFGLNEVGARIWQELENGASLSDAHNKLMTEFNVDGSVLQADILELIGSLEEAELIEASG